MAGTQVSPTPRTQQDTATEHSTFSSEFHTPLKSAIPKGHLNGHRLADMRMSVGQLAQPLPHA